MAEKSIVKNLDISGIDQSVFLGYSDRKLKKIESALSAKITVRGSTIILRGTPDEVEAAEKVFTELILLYNRHKEFDERDIDAIISVLGKKSNGGEAERLEHQEWAPILYTKDSAIRAKTPAQAKYIDKAAQNDLTFAIGPAGTGKTYLAVALAVANLRDRQVSRIVLTRPAVEAGESLGFLPGDLLEKVDPYLRPLYDALSDMLQFDKLQRYLDTKIVEVIPLAYMRGRTINNAFVILDEAQNTTPKQMKMFLTRLGIGSKAIVTGDITQIDLPPGTESGLIQAQAILSDVAGIDFVYLSENDVVRHRLVRDIINAYNAHNAQK
ncbi:MAG: PhoH family protein [Deferribacteres bacterium]|nr:PhoH family protein [candidate division KSB1 bacterium]MCB9512110.1 PhoH family protein [Deferribacteres bacterium]